MFQKLLSREPPSPEESGASQGKKGVTKGQSVVSADAAAVSFDDARTSVSRFLSWAKGHQLSRNLLGFRHQAGAAETLGLLS